MRIASISKSFTATGLMQQVEKGVISLDDEINDLIGFTIRNPYHPDDLSRCVWYFLIQPFSVTKRIIPHLITIFLQNAPKYFARFLYILK